MFLRCGGDCPSEDFCEDFEGGESEGLDDFNSPFMDDVLSIMSEGGGVPPVLSRNALLALEGDIDSGDDVDGAEADEEWKKKSSAPNKVQVRIESIRKNLF